MNGENDQPSAAILPKFPGAQVEALRGAQNESGPAMKLVGRTVRALCAAGASWQEQTAFLDECLLLADQPAGPKYATALRAARNWVTVIEVDTLSEAHLAADAARARSAAY